MVEERREACADAVLGHDIRDSLARSEDVVGKIAKGRFLAVSVVIS